MRLASFGSGPSQKAAVFAVETKETNMRAYSLNELFRLTRTELLALHAKIAALFPMLSEFDRAVARENLRLIRRVLARPSCAPS